MCSEGATAQEGLAQSHGFLSALIIPKMKLKQPCLFDVFTNIKQIYQGEKNEVVCQRQIVLFLCSKHGPGYFSFLLLGDKYFMIECLYLKNKIKKPYKILYNQVWWYKPVISESGKGAELGRSVVQGCYSPSLRPA